MSDSQDKNETSRFLGEGVSFKAKLIGILEVSEARGDRMCQEALSDLKMAIRAAGEHKQRITINIAIDGLRLRDEKAGDLLYHHPVHKISFIAQDMTDSRAFGYIFGSPDKGHGFFGIKTDKAASQVVIAMRDLFQVVFALKKKEIELAKQHLDKTRYGTSTIFSDTAISNAKVTQDTASKTTTETKSGLLTVDSKAEGPAVADLVDLELELNSLQQGINQMERITPSDPFGSKDDPFGDSFTSYTPKAILPPPPSGRERSSRTSESSSLFSPKTPHTVRSTDVSSAAENEDSTSTDWFASSTIEKPLDDSLLMPELSMEQQQHEITKQEILSQFDVFTELDPLGTGKIKPYVDKKDFFQELKNPPKKVLNDLVSEKQPQESKLFTATFDQTISTTPKSSAVTKNGSFSVDPFGEDPFDKADPFSEADPFDTESFGVEFKVFNKDVKTSDVAERFKFPPLEKSPNKNLAKQLRKHNTFDVKFDDKVSKLSHDNRSLDMSSESECAPDPPPRPASNLIQIKPPPLPPKKQPGDLCSKPPPRPPYSDDSHYDYIENYETGPNSIEIKKLDKSPPIPAPARKNKFESDFMSPPQRPKKQFSAQQGWSSEEDYLTPISFSKAQQGKEYKSVRQSSGSVLLPPPQRNPKDKSRVSPSRVETKSPAPVPVQPEKKLNTVEGLDITLSQLTLSGLNEIASKLDIPASRLSNMTLVQLTEYISNYIKDKSDSNMKDAEFTDFNADFANFNNFNEEPHDKYAVFRELLQEEIKQTKIDTEPVEHVLERKKEEEEIEEKISNLDVNSINGNENVTDRYAALRDIVENEIKQKEEGEEDIEANIINDEVKLNQDEKNILNEITKEELNNESNIINTEQKLLASKEIILPNNEVIEYSCIEKRLSPVPLKSPVGKVKSPVPGVVTEVLQNNNRLNSGSISDIISGSSPEVDNTGSNSEVIKKSEELTAESWAIFDQPNLARQTPRDKQSEDAASPWSSDSKEFFNGSPPDWSRRPGSNNWKRGKKDQEGWWDTSAEPEAQYCPSNRRSTDSYDDECYDYYDKPSRRRRPMTWSNRAGMGKEGEKGAAGQSSSSRDASPWEEEPRRKEIREARDLRDHRESWASRHSKGPHSLEKQRERRPADSWDEEDDYEYDEEHSGRYHWNERRSSSRESDKERHGLRERDSERWPDDWADNRRHRRRRKVDRDRWCCPNWEFDPTEQPGSRYRWQDRKPVIEDHYYARDSQESPWEDEYEKEPPEKCHSSHYLSSMTKRPNWKRPSSASEMDRKTGETRSRLPHYHTTGSTGGSDGERDRRYKGTRRSRSRDSQFTDSVSSHSRHKIDPNLTIRGPHRSKLHLHQKLLRDGEFVHDTPPKKLEPSKTDLINKRSTILTNRKKQSPKAEDSCSSKKLLFENNFMPSESESPMSVGVSPKFTFENDFETSEAESPIVSKSIKGLRFDIEPKRSKSSLRYENRNIKEEKISPSSRTTQRSPFEDDFSPPHEKSETPVHENVSSIKEEGDEEEEDLFATNNLDKSVIRRKKLNKNRFSNNFYVDHANLKKSESVNIFARESDPFDDEFFSEQAHDGPTCFDRSSRGLERKWTEDFEDFSFTEEK